MATVASLRQSFKCKSCGQWLMAPEWSTYVNEQQVTHLWACSKCGNKFKTSIFLDEEVPLAPEVINMYLPTLLVA
jgi:transcription elongation factor Elf1